VKPILDKLGITQATYYRSLKSGIWKLEHTANIANHFGVSLDYIVFGVETDNKRIKELEQELNLARNYLTTLLNDKNRTTATVPNGATGD